MSDLKALLERADRAVADVPLPARGLEGLERRCDRKRRNHRVAAGVLGIAVFALPAIGFVRLVGSERGPAVGPATSPSPTASPSPVTPPSTPFTERFDSPLHGLSIGYPSGWRTRAATEPWSHGEVAFGAPDVDVIFDPTLREDLYFAMVSEPLGDTSGSEWGHDLWMNLGSVGICTRAFGSGSGSGDTFHGNNAWWNEHCGTPAGIDDVMIVATATRGYIIYLHVADERRLRATYDWHWFEAALKTVDLRPEDAVDA